MGPMGRGGRGDTETVVTVLIHAILTEKRPINYLRVAHGGYHRRTEVQNTGI